VVFVGMGENDASKLVFVLDGVGKIGNHDINAVHIFIGKRNAAIHHQHVVALSDEGAIATDLPGPSEGQDFKLFQDP